MRRWFEDIQQEAQRLSIETDIENVPRTHVTLGVVSGFGFNPHMSDPRVRVDNGKLSPDPLGRTVAIASVNYHPVGFNPKARRMQVGERLSIFVGGVLKPTFGLAAGATVEILRGVGLTGGLAWMAIDRTQADDEIGQAPLDPANPVRIGLAREWFVGLCYRFR